MSDKPNVDVHRLKENPKQQNTLTALMLIFAAHGIPFGWTYCDCEPTCGNVLIQVRMPGEVDAGLCLDQRARLWPIDSPDLENME